MKLERLEKCNGAYINTILMIENEGIMPSMSENLLNLTEHFESDDEFLALFGLESEDLDGETLIDMIEDDNLNQFLLNKLKTGFIVEVMYPELYNFAYTEDGIAVGFEINHGVLRIKHFYGSSVSIIMDKMIEYADEYKRECINIEKNVK